MNKIDDAMLLAELKRRLEESRIAVDNLRSMTQNLEAVNEKLRQSEALKSDFLSNIRNEINNPLTAILASAKQIMDKKIDIQTARALASIVYHEAFDLDFQLRNIFTAAEIEAGEVTLGAAAVDIEALIRGQLAAFSHKAQAKRLHMEFSCESNDGKTQRFRTDPDKLQKIISNLLANAIEFNNEGKGVFVNCRRMGEQLTISISDEGIGIPAADRKKVFDRFVQLDSGVRKRHRGHGLGLSITKALVEMLGGSITLACEEGKGCVFAVSIPEMHGESGADASSADGNEIIFEEGTQF